MSKYKGVLLWPVMLAVKIVLVLLGLIVVPVALGFGRITDGKLMAHMFIPKLWRSTRGIPTFWENAIRNPADGVKFWFKAKAWHVKGYDGRDMEPHLMDTKFAYQYRWSGWFSMIRLVWVYNEHKYGEFFIGFKLGFESDVLDFAVQFRPYSTVGQ